MSLVFPASDPAPGAKHIEGCSRIFPDAIPASVVPSSECKQGYSPPVIGGVQSGGGGRQKLFCEQAHWEARLAGLIGMSELCEGPTRSPVEDLRAQESMLLH